MLLVLPGIASALTKLEVVDQLVINYGGEQNLQKLNGVRQSWKMHALTSNSEGHDNRKILLPDNLLVVLTYPNKTETRLISGDSGFRGYDGSKLRPANEMQRDAMRLQLMRLYTPLILRQKLAQLQFSDDRKFCILSIETAGLRVDYLVNKDNWRIEKVAGTMSRNGSEMKFLTEYSDFRMVDGVLVHHHENKYAAGLNTAALDLLSIEMDAELQPGDFRGDYGI